LIKRFSFADRPPGVGAHGFELAWRRAAAGLAAATPVEVGPVRVAVSIAVGQVAALVDVASRHDAVTIEWFADAEGEARHQDWSASAGGRARLAEHAAPSTIDTMVVVADEVVLRGADWLTRRWVDGGDRFKHMAVARRALGLTAAQFAQRWRDHAGHVGGSGGSTAIPAEVRGLAYIQNHPQPRPDDDEGYDAVNEVYFDDVLGLARRAAWFRDNRVGAQPDDLTGSSWFLAVRETVLFDRT
jgi:hypothetical protein